MTDMRTAFKAFEEANEVSEVETSFQLFLDACLNGTDDVNARNESGLALFYWICEKVESSSLPYLVKDRLFKSLREQIDTRSGFKESHESLQGTGSKGKLLISGAGPIGLRCAVESAMMGFEVTVIEKRTTFSRANILTLWQDTMDDYVSIGAKFFNKYIETQGSNLYMGTREIQLFLLKVALLLGVKVHYNRELHLFVPPDRSSTGKWTGVAKISNPENEPSRMGALDFKPLKTGDYKSTFRCNLIDIPTVDPTLFVGDESSGPLAVPFDYLHLAEGEWSQTSRRLGFVKIVDRFQRALGIVVNLNYDPKNPAEKKLGTFNVSRTHADWRKSALGAMDKAGIFAENVEYLRGSTHYIVATISKETLLQRKVLNEDLPSSAELLEKTNVNIDRLKALALELAQIVGLPSSVSFYPFNPVQLFDFSSRARCTTPFAILDGSVPGKPQVYYDRRSNLDVSVCTPVFPIGDALIEPFWPQGLGSNRGIHSVFDAVFASMVCHDQNLEECMKEREFAYVAMHSFAWTSKGLNKPTTSFKQWTLDPIERYSKPLLKNAANNPRNNVVLPERLRNVTF